MNFRIRHLPSDDEAEADTYEGAELAARTLLEDNGLGGTSYIHSDTGCLVQIVNHGRRGNGQPTFNFMGTRTA